MDKDPTQKQVAPSESGAQESVEKTQLEWGPEFGQISLEDAKNKIEELNKDMTEGERKWRFPTEEELKIALGKQFYVRTSEGFKSDINYWFSDVNKPQGYAWYGSDLMGVDSFDHVFDKKNKFLLRCVR
jgi:hypothetical protein